MSDQVATALKHAARLAVALGYVARGWAVLPLHSINGSGVCTCGKAKCKSPGKHPIRQLTPNGLKNASTDRTTIRGWWTKRPDANIGVRTGEASGFIVVDIDPRHGGDVSLENLIAEYGELPSTVTSLTGGGGQHFLFKWPGYKVGNRSGVWPGIDVRGDNGYIVVEPSNHSDGVYSWEASSGPDDLEIADAPDWLLQAIGGKPSTTDNPRAIGATNIDDGRSERCLREMMRVRIGDELDGSKRLFVVACRCVEHDLTDDQAVQLVRDYEHEHPFPRQYSCDEVIQRIRDAEKTQERGKPSPRATVSAHTATLATDVGNAARFVNTHGDRLRFCYGPNRWLVWTGQQWTADETGEVVRLAKETALGIFDEAKHENDETARERLAKWALTSQKRERVSAMVVLAQPELAVTPNQLDANPWDFNVHNGTIDLRSGQLRTHRREDLITKIAPVHYDPQAKCPRYHKFLSEIMDGDPDLIAYIQELHGMYLTGDITEQILPIYWGEGANGKNVLLDTTKGLMGDYADDAPPDLLTTRITDEHPTQIAGLLGQRLIVASETEEGRRLRVQFVKRITGDETLRARYMRQDYFTFRRSFKTVLVTNEKPTIRESRLAVWRRIRLLPFSISIPAERQDKRLTQKLRAEWPGILAWFVQGCLRWQEKGLDTPARVTTATEEYRSEEDVLGPFFDEVCEANEAATVSRPAIWRAYTEWAKENSERFTLNREGLYQRLRQRGAEDCYFKEHGRTRRGFRGVGIATQLTHPDTPFSG